MGLLIGKEKFKRKNLKKPFEMSGIATGGGSYVRKSIIGPYPLRASFFKRKEVTDRFEY